MYPPAPFCENGGKSTDNDRHNTSCCSDGGIVGAQHQDPAAKQCMTEAYTAMSMEVHSKGGGGGKWQDRHRHP